ncbi:MAG: sulfur carrier protein ThiS [Deltaproteobacteria bacterium]|nr:sulfur carrier protein ThiS [Deltaproteobacteria bacterium]
MRIICNDEKKEIRPGTTLGGFLGELGVNVDTVFIECDGVIIKKNEYDTFVLPDGAKVELIRFVGGG